MAIIKQLQFNWKSTIYGILVSHDPATSHLYNPYKVIVPFPPLPSSTMARQSTFLTRLNSKPSPDHLHEEAASPGTCGQLVTKAMLRTWASL